MLETEPGEGTLRSKYLKDKRTGESYFTEIVNLILFLTGISTSS